MVFKVQVFQGRGFSESRFFRVRVQVLEVVVLTVMKDLFKENCYDLVINPLISESIVKFVNLSDRF